MLRYCFGHLVSRNQLILHRKAQTAYLTSLEQSDMFSEYVPEKSSPDKENEKSKRGDKKSSTSSRTQSPQAKALKAAIDGLKGLHGKIYGDLPFGKREVGWGKLNADHLDEIFVLFRKILIPLVGLSTIIDIFERVAEKRGWVNVTDDQQSDHDEKVHEQKEKEKKIWNEMMKCLHEPFAVVMTAMDEGLEHAALLLEITEAPKKKDDIEADGVGPRPGNSNFSNHLRDRLKDFYSSRGEALKIWARERGLGQDQFETMKEDSGVDQVEVNDKKHAEDQQQLYLVLYMEFLVGASLRSLDAQV